MNYRLVSAYLAYFCFAIAVFMLVSALWAPYFILLDDAQEEWDAVRAFAASILLACAAGGFFALVGWRAPETLREREVLGLVSVSWFVAAGLGALPFYFAGPLGPVSAYFESMSGFTTTGSTVLHDIEALPRSILFWRSFTQWLGGMGIIVLFVAVLPYIGAGGKLLFKSESPGPDPKGLSPHIRDTATLLYKLYLGLTLLEVVALKVAGLSFYDALNHTFTTLATGGFSTKQASIGHWDRPAVEIIITFFMICAGTSFTLMFVMLRKDWKSIFLDTEWRVYILILVLATALIAGNLMYGTHHNAQGVAQPEGYAFGQALRQASFQTVSIMTTTGFGTDDFDLWPYFSRMLLVILMFVGGCAGSTGGGIKVIRLVMMAKIAYWRLEQTFRPKTVRAIRIGNNVIDDGVQRTVLAFFILYIAWFAAGSLFMSALGLDFQTAVTSVAATLNNIGPGLELVGATGDFAHIHPIGKLFLTLCMVLGRLELFAVCVLFLPSFWHHS